MVLSDDLTRIIDRLDRMIARAKDSSIQELIARLEKATEEIGKAWSGSPFGYHSNIYYDGLKKPPLGVFFNSNRDLVRAFGRRTHEGWKEHDPDQVEATVYRLAGNPNMEMVRKLDNEAKDEFNDCRMNVLSILETEMVGHSDTFLTRLKNAAGGLSIISTGEMLKRIGIIGILSATSAPQDVTARKQGVKVPPHLKVQSKVESLKSTLKIMESLAQIARQAKAHISRQELHRRKAGMLGGKVFIGHGHSPVWLELKDFITDRLNLPVDEFNSVAVAGLTTVERLNQMLDTASIAFLIMTGEDEQLDGKGQARMNVVHEAGLFQGRLGFHRAIIVLEENCEEFSNIAGLVQLRFKKNNIKEAFEDVRQVLERERLLQVD